MKRIGIGPRDRREIVVALPNVVEQRRLKALESRNSSRPERGVNNRE